MIGMRTATHCFNLKVQQDLPAIHLDSKEWDGGFGRQVLGETWVAHHGRHGKQSTRGVIVKGQEGHPILRGVADIWGPTDVYKVAIPLPGDSQPLVLGRCCRACSPPIRPWKGRRTIR